MKKARAGYAPNERGYFTENRRKYRTHAASGVRTLPEPIEDDIVANNISNVEFDYTYNRGEQI
ncbi:hypothetical protein P22_2050 [Propionispora sp. 2/2-37]|uniref:hypothetical protein n=1 Tax=Propionispora sp. 2/2-37 TaxID=1677858 RepID=UPI0006BB945F|nr:hypothetical protein [Propionispora sp. 2/2-37]CUH95962.1 hypothetical protein P22_2050 [Propionispora sp. 2/2-37]